MGAPAFRCGSTRLLRSLIRRRPRPPRITAASRFAANALVRFVASSNEGERNDRLFWAACRAFENGSFTRLEQALEDAAIDTGLTEGEVGAVFRSAERHAG